MKDFSRIVIKPRSLMAFDLLVSIQRSFQNFQGLIACPEKIQKNLSMNSFWMD